MTKKTPDKHAVDNYDYSKIDNFPNCKEDAEICPKCLERTGEERLGHRHEHIKIRKKKGVYVYEETETEIKVVIKIMHVHFALKKGTKVPQLDVARNVWCTIGERWANKEKETYRPYKLLDKKSMPDYFKDD